MSINETMLGQAQISSGANTTIFTVATGTTDAIRTILVNNLTGVECGVNIFHVASGSSAVDANRIYTLLIPATDFKQIYTFVPVESTGDMIQAIASVTTAATITFYGAKIV